MGKGKELEEFFTDLLLTLINTANEEQKQEVV